MKKKEESLEKKIQHLTHQLDEERDSWREKTEDFIRIIEELKGL